MTRIHLYFRTEPQKARFFPGDRYLIALAKWFLGKRTIGGVERVFINLCKSFDELNVNYDVNLPFGKINPGEPVVVLGLGKFSLKGYNQPNAIIAGIGLMTHPSEWPGLFNEYPVVKYLQHSDWTTNVYSPYYGKENCEKWPAGIDTKKWQPKLKNEKNYDFLIYNKIMWDKPQTEIALKQPIIQKLAELGLTWQEIIYGEYNEDDYYAALENSEAMIFLCEHESQGFACCEALSMNVPVFAWDPGYCLDPNRFSWNDPVIPATSVPFFDNRCGMVFKGLDEFNEQVDSFCQKVVSGYFSPREYVLENLTLAVSGQKMLEIINNVYEQ